MTVSKKSPARWLPLGVLLGLLLALQLASASTPPKKEIWVYTSMYKQYIAPIQSAFQKVHPEIDVHVFQGGSEKVQAKVEAEILSGSGVQADVILASDPFWPTDLDRRGWVEHREGHSVMAINYYSVMVLICYAPAQDSQCPHSFSDLADPRFDNQIQIGNPLESGTAFATVATLQNRYGWGFFEKLNSAHLASNGGNSSVIEKVESGEKRAGATLLENALASIKKGSPIRIIYPSDGVIPIPSVQIVMKSSKEKDAAGAFADFILTEEGQKLVRNGYMYPARPGIAAPDGAKPLGEILETPMPWPNPAKMDLIRSIASQVRQIKKKFAEILLE